MSSDPDYPNDVGGHVGFGRPNPDQVARPTWYRHLAALNSLLLLSRVYTMDDYRATVERLEPDVYWSLTYYERRVLAVETLSRNYLRARGGSGQAGPTSTSVSNPPGRPRFRVGSTVLVRTEAGTGHTRLPRYVRGATGSVESIAGARAAPEVRAAHISNAPAQAVYRVAFRGRDLWPETVGGDRVIVEIYDHQLEPVPATQDSQRPQSGAPT